MVYPWWNFVTNSKLLYTVKPALTDIKISKKYMHIFITFHICLKYFLLQHLWIYAF